MHKFSDVVHMDLNVSSSLLINWILIDLNDNLVIAIYGS